MTTAESIKRLKILGAFVIVIAMVLSARLYLVQVVHGDTFSARADRQYVKPAGNTYNRGNIFFQDKDGNKISAATLKSGYVVAINPKLLKNPEEAYNKLSRIIDIKSESFYLKAGKEDDPYEEIAHRVPKEKADQIQKQNIVGVNIHKERWRYYPGNTLASPVVGFVGFEGDERVGQYGIEQHYDDVLERSSKDLYVNFFAQVFSSIRDTVVEADTDREGDVVLTIEPTIQSFLEETLEKTHKKWSSEQTMGIIINPQNGEIKAMGVAPDFNPNSYEKVENQALFKNPLVQNVYEMGSIIKPITMAAGLDAGAVTPQTEYVDKGEVTLNGETIHNYDGEARGRVDMQTVLNESLNTGATFVQQELGNKQFRRYLYKFGLTERTGIDLPNEANPLIGNLDSTRDIAFATMSFGQGIAMTPIATVRALSALANNGRLVKPHVGDEIEYELGFAKELNKNPEGKRAISKEVSREITRMLVNVVDEALMDGEVKLDRYSVAAKTGTAQVAKPGGGYYENTFNHSFFGYFPAYDPKYMIFLMNIKPQGAKYASQTLTIPFMDLTKFLINYHEVAPDR